ncbi:M23 family metallopeptidase [Streptomyces axinellae]|uniref:M23 family metallopeptidase n=2 Tax=Streptomyces axinellae TaxID=552788 RepID=A0ABN3PYF6_9ACTN
MALGAGAATAADRTNEAGAANRAGGDVFASDLAGTLADSARHQADQQHKAADAAKQAKQRAAQKAARDAKRLQLSWVKPVSVDYELSASFGKAGGRWAHNHSGQDFAVKIGTPVKSVHKGTVVKAGGNGAGDGPAYGNAIVIRHSNGEFSQYAHLSQIDVKPGQQVRTGQTIGKSGNTGNSSGPHLHFEIRKSAAYGSAVDPKDAMRSLGVRF